MRRRCRLLAARGLLLPRLLGFRLLFLTSLLLLPSLLLLLALPVLGGCQALNQVLPSTAAPALSQTTAVATFTPTPDPNRADLALDIAPLIDAAGLDFAERRIIDVYERVNRSVVYTTTITLEEMPKTSNQSKAESGTVRNTHWRGGV